MNHEKEKGMLMPLSAPERKWLYETLKKINFLSVLTFGEMDKLAESIFKKSFAGKSVICRQGAPGDCFYIVYKGTVSVWASREDKNEQLIAKLKPGSYFGESALVSGEPRNATAIADSRAELFVLLKNDFSAIVEKNPQLKNRIRGTMAVRTSQRTIDLLHARPEESKGFFSRLSGFFRFNSKAK